MAAPTAAVAAAAAAAITKTKFLLTSSMRAAISKPTLTKFVMPNRSSSTGPTFIRGVPRTFCCSSSTTPVTVEEESNSVPVVVDPIKEAAETLDIRVGKVLKAWKHPEADSLYVEEVDVGEAEPRIICSGLVGYIPIEQIQETNVVVLANLKPRNMRGIKSNGMLMAASDASHENIELLRPPEGSVAGERIWFGSEEDKGRQSDAASPNQVQKKKIWESVQPHLKTTDTCTAVLGERPMRTSAGVVTCSTLKKANIS